MSAFYPLDVEDDTDQTSTNIYLHTVPRADILSSSPKCVLFSPKFCLNVSRNFSIREKVRMNRDSCFKVYDMMSDLNNKAADASSTTELFKVSNPVNSIRGKHVITHVNGDDLVKIKKKLLSVHPIWHMNGGSKLESRLATLVFELTLLKKKAHVYQYEHPYPNEDDDTNYEHIKPSLLIKSDNTARDFKVFDALGTEVFATITKRQHGNSELLVETDNYTVTVNPGVDVLFMISLALMYQFAISDSET